MLRIGTTEEYYSIAYGFAEGVRRMKKQGYDCMDYSQFVDTRTELFQMNCIQFRKHLENQKNICQSEGIEIHQAHGPWRYPPRDAAPEDRAERFEKMTRAIEGTAMLGCGKMVIHPLMPYGIQDEGHEQETYDINLEFMSRLAEAGKANDVMICYENMPMPLLSMASMPSIMKLVREVNNDYFKICLDVGHSVITKNLPADAVRMIGKDLLQALHIHDNNGKHDVHIHPYAGVINWEAFCMALKEIGYEGVMSLEIKMQKDLPMELRHLEEQALFKKIEYLTKLVSA